MPARMQDGNYLNCPPLSGTQLSYGCTSRGLYRKGQSIPLPHSRTNRAVGFIQASDGVVATRGEVACALDECVVVNGRAPLRCRIARDRRKMVTQSAQPQCSLLCAFYLRSSTYHWRQICPQRSSEAHQSRQLSSKNNPTGAACLHAHHEPHRLERDRIEYLVWDDGVPAGMLRKPPRDVQHHEVDEDDHLACRVSF